VQATRRGADQANILSGSCQHCTRHPARLPLLDLENALKCCPDATIPPRLRSPGHSTILHHMHTIDRLIASVDNAMRSVSGAVYAARPNPGADLAEPESMANPDARRKSGALMRVNHVGEVCAQALYQAQALTARSPELRLQIEAAAREETDHLAWTQQRLHELGARPSLLNPLWYAGSFAIGLVAGRLGDATSLGFVVETENQVEQHLAGHLDRLPADDLRSRAIVAQMKDDEHHHAMAAAQAGAVTLPGPVRWLMRAAAKVMTGTAARI
jgi:3-demethoxyubiquinol 3-hydroxylase